MLMSAQKTTRSAMPAHRPLRVVCLGGGHGLHATLEAMRLITSDVTAIVCVGDDGGSSGRLRKEFPGLLPPGDIRMALSALASEPARRRGVVGLLQHRFHCDGELDGHSLGNLILTAQWQRSHGAVLSSISFVQQLLGIDGTVIPGAAVPLDLTAHVRGDDGTVSTVTSQRGIAHCSGRILDFSITPADPPVFQEALDAIAQADIITMGPGSWFTSLLVHLHVPKLRQALRASRARKILLMDLVPDAETHGLRLQDQYQLFRDSLGAPLDAVIAGPERAGDELDPGPSTVLLLRRLSVYGHPEQHDRVRLAAALKDAIDEVYEDDGTPALPDPR
jgi:uncharacterized cofD-like protein